MHACLHAHIQATAAAKASAKANALALALAQPNLDKPGQNLDKSNMIGCIADADRRAANQGIKGFQHVWACTGMLRVREGRGGVGHALLS